MQYEPRRVLLIGPETPAAETVRHSLEAEMSVHRADSTRAGLALATTLRPTLLILDAAIQRRDAADLCQTLRADPHTAGIPVLVLVLPPPSDSNEAAAVASSWLVRGIDDVLVGPISSDLLLSRVRLLIELRRLRQDSALALRDDPSKTVASRRVFDCALRRESYRLRRSDGYLGLLLVEIDDVATWRAGGDETTLEGLLNRLAETVAGRLRRPPDLAARFGPDQIACLLPETDLRGARVVAESIRGAVAAQAIAPPGVEVARPLTVSVGVASHRCSGPDVENWLLADALDHLAKARRGGGDRLTALDSGRRASAGGIPAAPAAESGGGSFLEVATRCAGWS